MMKSGFDYISKVVNHNVFIMIKFSNIYGELISELTV